MKTLKITVKVEDEIEAYQALNRLARRHKVEKAKLSNKEEKFDKNYKPKDFLKNK